jgi:hypothetical protein
MIFSDIRKKIKNESSRMMRKGTPTSMELLRFHWKAYSECKTSVFGQDVGAYCRMSWLWVLKDYLVLNTCQFPQQMCQSVLGKSRSFVNERFVFLGKHSALQLFPGSAEPSGSIDGDAIGCRQTQRSPVISSSVIPCFFSLFVSPELPSFKELNSPSRVEINTKWRVSSCPAPVACSV